MKRVITFLAMLMVLVTSSFAATTDPLCFTALEAGATVGFKIVGSFSKVPVLQYSTNGSTWNDYDLSGAQQVTLSSVGSKVYFRAKDKNSTFSKGYTECVTFTSTAKVAASGNIMSLLDNTCKQTTVPSFAFVNLFEGCGGLTSAPELPATTLEDHCYHSMFFKCTNLTAAPKLPAMTLAGGCYGSMFSECTNLTTAPELPATTIARYCYQDMFLECENLKSAPKLPATKMERSCYSNMFVGCKGLATAPELPATELAQDCYYQMFSSCESLTTAPKLPATTMEEGCYKYMFSNCHNITAAPELPATTLAKECYYGMFSDCRNLKSAPKLPATTLAEGCYEGMFYWDYNLEEAPELPATTLADYCYKQMFFRCYKLTETPALPAKTLTKSCYESMFYCCTKLSSVTVNFTDWNTANSSTKDWLSDVSSTGTFNCPAKLNTTQRSTSTVPSGWTVKRGYIMPKECFRIVTLEADTKVWFTKSGTLTTVPSLVYSTDEGNTWKSYTFNNQITLAEESSVIYFMAKDVNESFSQSTQNKISFGSTRTVSARGNIMSLLDNTCTQTTVPKWAFIGLFYGAFLTRAPELPALTVGEEAYREMFRNSSLLYAPELPATTVGDYSYQSMFEHCTKLKTVPKELPAKKVEWYSYFSMFKECTSITESPFIAAETLDYTEACGQMFQGCSKLSKVNVAFTSWDDSTENWLKDVSSTGTFTCPAALNISTRGVDTVPTGWNIVRTKEATPTIVDLTKLIDSILKGGSSTINDVNTLRNKILKK